jgi:seryl-tRNA synthetase
MGTPLYLMASIVWRWNHPDNTKAQINTRGYPNDRLWNDLLIFYFNIDKHKETINVASVEREERLAEIKQRKEVEEAERVEREKEQKIQHRKRRIEAQKRLEKERKEIALRIPNFCEKHNIPVFTAESHGNNDWEISFLVDMIGKIHSGNFMSEKQLLRTIKIVKGEEDMATENQLSYIRKLGGTPNADLTKRDASQMIDELKNPSGEEE